jgi:hypothetical protein
MLIYGCQDGRPCKYSNMLDAVDCPRNILSRIRGFYEPG